MMPAHPIMMAGIAQKMLRILALNCPSNYNCGGPAYAATSAVDSIMHLMGIGQSLLQRQGREVDTEGFEKHIRENAVCGDSLIGQFVQHKSQILAGGMHCILSDLRHKTLRECEEITEEALLSVMQWYFDKTGASPDEFMKRLAKGDHDELIQLEKADDDDEPKKEAS